MLKLKFITIIILTCLMILFSGSRQVFAQMLPETPHEKNAIKTGTLSGTLLMDGKKPLPEHQVILEIARQGEIILTIPKKTDSKGGYQFKNIFQSPEFSYAVSTEHDGVNYRSDIVSLKKGEDTKKLDLIAGVGGKEVEPVLPEVHNENIHTEKSSGEYKLLAVILSIAAAGFAFYQRKRT